MEMNPGFRYESVLESISGGFFALDSDYKITYWNKPAEIGTGLSAEEVLGKDVFEVFPNARDAELGAKYRLAMETRTYQSFETAYKDDRFEAWYDVRVYPSQDGLAVFFQDITAKMAEQRQKEVLVGISSAINEATQLDDLCLRVVAHLAPLFDLPSTLLSVFLYDGKGNELRLVAPIPRGADVPQGVLHQPVMTGAPFLAARAAFTRGPVIHGDVALSAAGQLFPGDVARHAARSALAMPLLVGGELQGVLEILSLKQKEFASSEVEVLSMIADDLALGMSRRRLIDELRLKNVELETQTQKTTEASDTLKKFLATFSHELRSPLNSIIGFSELLTGRMGEIPPETVKEFMQNINTSGRHLQQIINDILDLSKIEAGKLELHLASYPAAYFEDAVRRVLSAAIAHKAINLQFVMAPELDEFVVDQTRFKQILINLVSNAIKFSRNGGTITVRSARVENDIEITVEDHGIGIKPEEVSSLFKPFRQAQSGKAFNREGMGLGLAITKRLVELHGGSIHAESTWGEGTTMRFRIPMMVDATSEQMLQAGMLLDALRRENTAVNVGEKPLALIVEDSPQAGELLQYYIESAGYRVALARNGLDAMEMAKRLRPSVITLDLLLPMKDGWQVLKELKRHPLCKNIPVIIVSIVDEKSLGFSLGAVDYFVKPVNRDDLVAALNKVHVLPGRDNRKPAVLVIDDDRAATDLVQVILENEGYTVTKTHEGRKGVEIAIQDRPDIIILDLIMPDTSGFNIAYQLKQHAETRHIPIIILTSMEIDDELQEQLSAYVAGLMSKSSFTKGSLIKEISNIEAHSH
jgi:PAS domain S-box-containing protein